MRKLSGSIELTVEGQSIPFHTMTTNQIEAELKTTLRNGLSNREAESRLIDFGPNELVQSEPESIWDKIKEQFEDLLVRILLGAAMISFIISLTGNLHNLDDYQDTEIKDHSVPGWVEPLVILIILVLNGAVGIYQDYDAEKALDALKRLQSIVAVVLRDGTWRQIHSREVVPGDIIQVQQVKLKPTRKQVHPGDKVPADMRIIELTSASLRVDQSAMTGENQTVKWADIIQCKECSLSEKYNMLYSSTLILSGSCIGVAIATGMSTEIGKIQSEIANAEEEESPLQQRLNEFGEMLAKTIGVICLICWIMNYKNFSDPIHGSFIRGCLYYFKVAVALAVAAIPEGLPAVVTACLALGTRRMAKENAIVRRLAKVETLGCTTVICSDKTGTLTTNKMAARELVLYGEKPNSLIDYTIQGVTYQSMGEIAGISKGQINNCANLRYLCECMSLNNDSKLIRYDNHISQSGLPTEAALKVLVEKLAKYDIINIDNANPEAYGEYLCKDYKKLATLEFTRERKSMSVLCKNVKAGKNVMFIKGAPDYFIKEGVRAMLSNGDIISLSGETITKLQNKMSDMASRGLRTLAICYKEDCGILRDYDGPSHPSHKLLMDSSVFSKFETDPIILGIVGIQDPPRPGVSDAIYRCRKAGIQVVMITGDNKETAQCIARDIGIVGDSEIEESSFNGIEFESFSDSKQIELLATSIKEGRGLIFSRTEPRHKKLLVKLFSQLNQIVAMTGDGVNDAPALKQANVGIAMGLSGTDVAKEASDIILADDNFATIVKAVEEGRSIFANMQAFIRYMISSNIGEVVSIFASSALGIPDGFNSIQLLWVNLVTDGFPATALSFNPADPNIMSKPPRKHNEPIVTGWVFTRYIVIGTYVGLATVGIFIYWYLYYDWAGDGHKLVTFRQLSSWGECSQWKDFTAENFGSYSQFDKNPCLYFSLGKETASTLSLTVLVMIEMFNSLNALSEDSSLLTVGLFGNLWLLLAISLSVVLHCLILYIPFLRPVFGTVPLTVNDWKLVLWFSFPVILIDEILKFISRFRNKRLFARAKKLHQLLSTFEQQFSQQLGVKFSIS